MYQCYVAHFVFAGTWMTKVSCNCTEDPFHRKPKTVDPTQLEYKVNNLICCILDHVFNYDFWTLLPEKDGNNGNTFNGCIYVGTTNSDGVVSNFEVSINCSCLC